MTVDLGTLKVGDTIVLRDDSRHVVSKVESHWRDDCIKIETSTLRFGGCSLEKVWNHEIDGSWTGGNGSYRGDIVKIIPKDESSTVDLSTLKVGDVITLRDGSKHRVTVVEADSDKLYSVATARERIGHMQTSNIWHHSSKGYIAYLDQSQKRPGDIVHIYHGSEVFTFGPPDSFSTITHAVTDGSDLGLESKEKPTHDEVNSPKHYTDGKIEVIDYIEDKQLGFCLGNAIKYISRAGKKDPSKRTQDLEKAVWYLQRQIKEWEMEAK